jgi:hypothetical protein
MIKPDNPIPNPPEKKEKKRTMKLRDLAPKKDAKGGRKFWLDEPPLQIPPPGFITDHDED